MTQDYKLPPLVGTLAALPTRHREVIEAYATAAIELNQQGRGEPVGWLLITGHGTQFAKIKPKCEVDYWKPVYLHPQPAAPVVKDDEYAKA